MSEERKKTHVLIVVQGGVVQSVLADGPVEINVKDWDNIKAGDQFGASLDDFCRPGLCTPEEFEAALKEDLEDWQVVGNPATFSVDLQQIKYTSDCLWVNGPSEDAVNLWLEVQPFQGWVGVAQEVIPFGEKVDDEYFVDVEVDENGKELRRHPTSILNNPEKMANVGMKKKEGKA